MEKSTCRSYNNWRTFDDSGPINDQWNRPATPAFYIIDHDGVIRHKWIGKPGEKTVDAALKKLIGEAENFSLPTVGTAR